MKGTSRLLVFVRHGQAVSSADVFDTDAQRPLTPAGAAEAHQVASALTLFGTERLYCSPSLRAQQTAAFLEQSTGLRAEIVPELQERSFAAFEGQTLAAIAKRHGRAAVDAVNRQNTDALEVPGIEPFVDAQRRGNRALLRLLDQPQQRLVVVAHGGPHSWFLSHLLGVEPGRRLLALDTARMTVLRFRLDSGTPVLDRVLALNAAALPAEARSD